MPVTLEADGMYETLKKLKGLDTGQISKVLVQAAPVLLPAINNLSDIRS